MVFGLIGKLIDWNRGLVTVMGPRFGESRARAYARRLRRMGVSEHNIKVHLKEAEDKGNIKKVVKEMKKLVKIENREGKLIFLIEDKEDVVEFNAAEELGNTMRILNNIKGETKNKAVQKLKRIIDEFGNLAKLQLGKVSYLMEGGKPWEGITNIASWDMGTTENVILGEAWKQRSRIAAFRNSLNLVRKYGEQISNEMRAKAPRVNIIKNSEKKMNDAADKLDSVFRELSYSIKLQFYCTLRLVDFMQEEFKMDNNIIHHFKDEGFPESTAEMLKKEVDRGVQHLSKGLVKEQGRLMLIVSQMARAA